jgi:hypothetical protein
MRDLRQHSPVPWFASFEILSARPGQIAEIIGKPFVVTRPWPDLGVVGIAGRPLLEAWPCGTRGVVAALLYDSGRGWAVIMEREAVYPSMGLEIDEINTEVDVAHFLRCTAPSDPDNRWLDCCGLPAANDPDQSSDGPGGGT